jgi:predicted Zn-dependent peptidase
MVEKVAILSARYGSIDLKFKRGTDPDFILTPPGIAHFLEHQLFKKQDEDMLCTFARFGTYANASTDYTHTTYYFNCTSDFEGALRLLFRLLFTPYFAHPYIEKEKLIIAQEISLYEDTPDYKVFKNLLSILYHRHPVKIDIAGDSESIKEITMERLWDCWRGFYHPENMVLVMAGELEPEVTFTLAQGLLEGLCPGKCVSQRDIPEEPATTTKDSISQQMTISRPRVLVGFKDKGKTSPQELLFSDLNTQILLELLFGKVSDFYTKAYLTGVIDDTFGYSHVSSDTFAFTTVGGETERPQQLVERLKDAIKKVLIKGLKRRDIYMAKRKRMGQYISSLNTPGEAAFTFLGCYQKGIDIFDIPDAMKKVSRDSLMERLKDHLIDDSKMGVSILYPG